MIMLGNLSIKEMETRTGIKFPADLVAYMGAKHQDKAEDVMPGKWHCFDIPFTLVCGDMDTATEIYSHLKSMSGDFKHQLHISLQKGSTK